MTTLADTITVEQLRDDVTSLAGRCLCDPVTELFGPLLEVQERVFNRLENDPEPDHAHELYLLAALVSGMLAKAHHDLDREHQAMSLARMAYVCADNIGHPGLRAWSRGLQSLLAYSAGRPQGRRVRRLRRAHRRRAERLGDLVAGLLAGPRAGAARRGRTGPAGPGARRRHA
ncbi:hypothetical protein ACFQZ4_00300 [Catellatospora coxensis]